MSRTSRQTLLALLALALLAAAAWATTRSQPQQTASDPTAAPAAQRTRAPQPAQPSRTPQSARATPAPQQAGASGLPTARPADLPPEARTTLRLIAQGGPFPFRRDGVTFENREGRLPKQQRGYYREYTVVTPGEDDRGARRVIAGRGGELFYTADHYDTFVEVLP